MIEFTIPGKPVPKERPRKGAYGFYTPSKTKSYEEVVRWSWLSAHAKDKNFKGLEANKPISVEIEVYLKKAKSSKLLFPTAKPDADNLAKSILDALNGHAYVDDGQVISLKVEKFFDKQDYVKVRIMEV